MLPKSTAARIVHAIKWTVLVVLLLMLTLYVVDCEAAEACDPIALNQNPTPVATTAALDPSTDGTRLYAREVGAVEWVAVADHPCLWRDDEGRITPAREPGSTRWCRLDTIGAPTQRHTELTPAVLYEWQATAYNSAGESAPSNVVEHCEPYRCDPATDPAACTEWP